MPQNGQGRKPDMIAYPVRNTADGQGYWSRVGAAWNHKDGKGQEIVLESVPVDGRITLREQREQQVQKMGEQRAEQAASQDAQAHGYSPER